MLDQCIYACASKGLPSSMHYSYQCPTKVCLPACTTHINGQQRSAFQHALLISMASKGLPSSMHYSYQCPTKVCLPACTTHINGQQRSAFQHALLISMASKGLPSSMHYSYQWPTKVCLPACTTHINGQQVCLPACTTHINGQQRSAYQHALLISMGILYKLYSLLEEECHLLDLKLALQLSTDAELTTASYEEYATAVRELTAYKEQLEVLRQEHCSLKDLFNYSVIIVGESSPLLSSLIEDGNYSSKIVKLVSYFSGKVLQSLWLYICMS